MINLIYIRAAIRERTGQELSLEAVRDLLLEEGLITQAEANDEQLIFKGYDEYFDTEEAAKNVENADIYVDKEVFDESDES